MIRNTREGKIMAAEATELAWRIWEASEPRASVLLVHGLGEHSGRYRPLAEVLAAREISVFTFDLRGHGRSQGERGDVSAFPRFLEDLLVMEEVMTAELPQSPRFLLGHSLGGLIALERLRTLGEGFVGAVFSAPWLAVAQPGWLRRFGRALGWLFPRIPVPGGLGPSRLTRDPGVAEAWRNDPLIHTRVTGGLFREAERVQRELLRSGLASSTPLLFLVPTADRVVDAGVTLDFVPRIVGGQVDLVILEGGLHEPFNDLGREEVLQTVADWMEGCLQRCGVDD
ncbi:MAG: alpha/beta hydrolase [Longimicrobiales bacterium]